MVLMDPERLKRRGIKREIHAENEAAKYDPTIKPPEFYAEAAKGGGIADLTYKPPFPKHTAWPYRTQRVVDLIRPDDVITELGCGFGILPAIAWHSGHRGSYLGIDFCQEALDCAALGNRGHAHQSAEFIHGTLDDPDGRRIVREFFLDIDTVGGSPVCVCCETLEHLENDVELIKAIPAGTFCIFTVPKFWAKSHLRRFQTPKEAQQRYGHLIHGQFRPMSFYKTPGSGWILIWGYRK
ncbi:MAG: class I SAM-dependent methyltransferase [Planctomycetota bacterium]|jgi:hypothetical protein